MIGIERSEPECANLRNPVTAFVMQRIPRLPGYELFQYLGGGPLTAVYAGRDCATDEPCAVKVLRED